MLRRSRHSLLGCGLAGLAGLAGATQPCDTGSTGFNWRMQLIDSFVDTQPITSSVVFIGDSILHRMYLSPIVSDNVNFAIAGNSTVALCIQAKKLHALKTARAAVIHIGTNDAANILQKRITLDQVKANLVCISNAIQIPLVWTGLHQTTQNTSSFSAAQKNPVIDELNDYEHQLALSRGNTVWVPSNLADDNGQARPELLYDGLHPNPAGYALWAPAIRQGLKELLGW